MLYYHGSNKLFDRFDPNLSKSPHKTIHLTPHIEYAKRHALSLPGDHYVYTVRIKNADLAYNEHMQNVCLNNPDALEIIEVTKM